MDGRRLHGMVAAEMEKQGFERPQWSDKKITERTAWNIVASNLTREGVPR